MGTYDAIIYPSGALTYSAAPAGFGSEMALTGANWARPPYSLFGGLGAAWTIEARVKTTVKGKNIAGHDAPDASAFFLGTDSTTGVLRGYVSVAGTAKLLTGTSNLCDGASHHGALIACPGSASTVPAPTTSLFLLQDGAVVASTLNVAGAYSTSQALSYQNDDLGSSGGNAGNAWTGTLDELAVSNVAVYPTTGVYTVPAAPIPAGRPGLLALYRFDGTLVDSASPITALTAGSPFQAVNGDGTATLNAGAATGGVSGGVYTYAWFARAFDDDHNTVVVGTTQSLVLTGLVNGQAMRYECQVSDGVTTVVSPNWVYAIAQKPLSVVWIGDSLTGGADGTAAPVEATSYLQALLPARKLLPLNYGAGGTRSDQWRTDSTTAYTMTGGGYDAVAAGSPNTLLNHALAAINAAITTYGAANVLVPVCLGTNDPNTGDPAGNAVTTAANLTNLLTAIQATGAKIVLSDIPWRADYGNTYMAARSARFDGIAAALGGPAANVYRGDRGAVVAFQQGHTEYFLQPPGPHDAQLYQVERAKLWGAAIARSVFGIGSGAAAGTKRRPM